MPILLALGIGVMQSTRQKRLAKAALEGSVAAGAGQALEGFGVVTLASLWPVLAVELMGIIDGAIYDKEYVLEQARIGAAKPPATSAIETSPLKEVVYAIRSIMPLVIVLIFIVLVILRSALPKSSFWVDPPAEEDLSVKSGTSSIQRSASANTIDSDDAKTPVATDNLSRCSVAIAKGLEAGEDSEKASESERGSFANLPSLDEGATEETEKVGCWTATGRWFRDNAPLLGGVAMTQIGMIMFNEGLTYSFTKLGDQTGSTLPAAFLKLPNFPKSPYYSYAGGLILVLVVVFLLGVLATKAEPAHNVLGRTVERLSGRAFTSRMLIGAVCVGVGTGLAVGAAKILYSLPIIYFILGKYAVAVVLTFFSAEAITAVAWDSAGVTTG